MSLGQKGTIAVVLPRRLEENWRGGGGGVRGGRERERESKSRVHTRDIIQKDSCSKKLFAPME